MKDLDGYNLKMKNTIYYKRFFLSVNFDKEKVKYIIDYGCANGELIKEILKNKSMKHALIFGFDNNESMIKKAKENVVSNRVYFSSNWNDIMKLVVANKTFIIFSSVLHEVYTYNNAQLPIFSNQFAYVAIRDMYFQKRDTPVPLSDYLKVLINSNKKMLFSFLVKNHFLINEKSLSHFLLKSLYKDNWETEVKENYFSTPFEELIKKLTDKQYKIIYNKRYSLPFIDNYIHKTFSISAPYKSTHISIMFESI